MKSKYIILREGYDWLSVGNAYDELTLTEFNALCMYLKNNISSNVILYGYNKIKIINYVGIISVGNLVIEILPKISLTNDEVKDREMLIFMLSKCKKLSVDINEIIRTNVINNTLLDILSKVYVDKLLKELQKGLYFEYVYQENSLNKIKGKVMLTQNIKKNAMNKSRVYCKYDEFTENNMFNGILKKATDYLVGLVRDNRIRNEINIIRNILGDVDDIFISQDTLMNFKINRKNERFKESFTLAKLILLNSSMDKSVGKDNGFSILFEMNYLYEEYIGILIKEVLEDTIITVNTQEKSKYLLINAINNRNEVALKPDIVIYESHDAKVIIDTKWKAAAIENREVYSQSDIYQMYAYITTYQSCGKCILLYPKINKDYNHSVWKLNNNFDKRIFIKEISLESYYKTKSELKLLLSN